MMDRLSQLERIITFPHRSARLLTAHSNFQLPEAKHVDPSILYRDFYNTSRVTYGENFSSVGRAWGRILRLVGETHPKQEITQFRMEIGKGEMLFLEKLR